MSLKLIISRIVQDVHAASRLSRSMGPEVSVAFLWLITCFGQSIVLSLKSLAFKCSFADCRLFVGSVAPNLCGIADLLSASRHASYARNLRDVR